MKGERRKMEKTRWSENYIHEEMDGKQVRRGPSSESPSISYRKRRNPEARDRGRRRKLDRDEKKIST